MTPNMSIFLLFSCNVLVIISHKGSNAVTQTAVTHKDSEKTAVTQEQKTTITHEEEKIALILTLTGIFTVWYLFQ